VKRLLKDEAEVRPKSFVPASFPGQLASALLALDEQQADAMEFTGPRKIAAVTDVCDISTQLMNYR